MFDKKIKFIKSFSSTTYGNVYINKELVVGHKQAKSLIENGLAVEVSEKVKEDGVDNTSGSKKSLKSRSKRRG